MGRAGKLMRRNVDEFSGKTFDLAVIGGGITGAGVALDAATRGLKVALIDKGDFASGTSSISSKLVHGGLRYLEQGDLPLVYEALHERANLLRNAPHLAWPLRFLLPFYQPSRVPPWKWRLGLTLYDMLAGRGNIRRSRHLEANHLRREVPGLSATGLLGAAEYHDAQMDDARLCLEVVHTAHRHGAVVANYVEAVGFDQAEGRVIGVDAHDLLTGRHFRIATRQVVNAAGPWGDNIRGLAGDGGEPMLRPTKGVHLVAPGRQLPAGFLLLHPRDGRVFFILPWLGKTLLGTTDTDCSETPDALTISEQDVAYLLEGHNHYFSPGLKAADLVGQFVGVRPLLRARAGDPSSVSREYRLEWSSSGLLTVAGGKYTTYRHMAEVVVDAVLGRLGLRRHCRTRNLPLFGTPSRPWPDFVESMVQELTGGGLMEPVATHLVHRYGTQAGEVADYARLDPALARGVTPGEPDILAEFAYHKDHEMAVRADDFLLRRTRLGLFGVQNVAYLNSMT